mgnify:CR=1 FL=1
MDRHAWDARYATTGLLWGEEPNRFLVTETAGLSPGRALDLACGHGRNAVWLARNGWDVTGVDFSEVGLGKARDLAAGQGVEVEWVAADLNDYEPEPAAFDLVVVLYLQLPEPELTPVLVRAAGALAPGGTILIVSHDATNIAEGAGGPQDPDVLATPESLATHLPSVWVQRAERVRRPVTVDGAERMAIDALVRARRPVTR